MLLLSLMCLLLAAAQNPAGGQEIQIMGNSVILICSGAVDGHVKWYNEGKTFKEEHVNKSYEVQAIQETVKGWYSCEYGEVQHTFYLKVKVCENCYELSALRAWSVILGDLLITAGVILIVYYLSTRNSSSTQKKASNSRPVNPPRPPNPDYEALDPKMRSSNALYAGLNK
ncbi:T-cell surface glycoprotein CD3 epsilon chain-like [Puntigrus tetrazona]|uniref:T-cell surface glycoprotein CD3 epsilon chain-like n=1 Tax=Puntigrus tetrazona TaxID=1606681 RepID=UPI001C8AA71B|nr:T-cell surface glycoprotein CD3 epsilon chain-like [Puntigrus tetrazona]